MPRQNRPREVYAEAYLAERIAAEREARRMSYEGLAERMTRAGCPLSPSAIFKIEKGQPRRRIVVDELVAFAKVFDIPLAEMVVAPELRQATRLAPLLEAWVANFSRRSEAIREADAEDARLRAALIDAVHEFPDARAFIGAFFSERLGPESTWPERLADMLTEED